jgi:hypothetical protein
LVKEFSSVPQGPSKLTRLTNFLIKNRQALINTVGVYFVLSYSVYNYKVKLAWEEFQKDFDTLHNEHERLKTILLSDEVITELEDAMRCKKPLREEILQVIKNNSVHVRGEQDVATLGSKENAQDASELAAIGTTVADIGQAKSAAGKII